LLATTSSEGDSLSNVLVTGGAGFVGSHTVDLLVSQGHDVVSLDSLDPAVHGEARKPPAWLNEGCRYVEGDVRDPAAVARALEGRTHVLHLAAALGVARSMYAIAESADVNATGTGVLLEALVGARGRIARLVVASSMSIYGEGAYLCAACGPVLRGVTRTLDGRPGFEPRCPSCDALLEPIPTTEEKAIEPASVYALGKYFQEVSCLTVGASVGIPALALRYFNVYGPRQALGNPYTGVAAIFCARLLNGLAPHCYEDGLQRRDFVHVSDVARANVLALFAPPSVVGPVNVGSGESRSVLEIARTLAQRLRPGIEATISGERRTGDTRHCFADGTVARAQLGFEARARFEDAIDELARAVAASGAAGPDRFDAHRSELLERGLAA
jgi:dTDP-L-rhamnose 4-epimerase